MIARFIFAHDKLAEVDVATVHRLDELTYLNAIEILEKVVFLNSIFDLLLRSKNNEL